MSSRTSPRTNIKVEQQDDDEPLVGLPSFRDSLQRFRHAGATMDAATLSRTRREVINAKSISATTSSTITTSALLKPESPSQTPLVSSVAKSTAGIETPLPSSRRGRRPVQLRQGSVPIVDTPPTSSGSSSKRASQAPSSEERTSVIVTPTTIRRSSRTPVVRSQRKSPHFASGSSDSTNLSSSDEDAWQGDNNNAALDSDDDDFSIPSSSRSKLKRKRSRSAGFASSSSSSDKKARKPALGWADPSVYADLDGLNDHFVPGLDVIMCGINPGRKSAMDGHHYAHPSNHFYKCVHQSGFTQRRVHPSAGHKLVKKASMGLTNLVERPTRQETELHKSEKRAGCAALLEKIMRNRPHFVSFAGMDVGRVFRDYIRGHVNASHLYTYSPDQGLPPVVPQPLLDSSYDSSEEDYFVPKLKSPKKKKAKMEAMEIDWVDLKVEEGEGVVHAPIISTIGQKEEEVKVEVKDEALIEAKVREDWAPDLGLQPVVLLFPPLGDGTGARTRTYLWLLPSPSGLVRPYQLPDKVAMFKQLREALGKVKKGEDPFAGFEGEVREFEGERILSGVKSEVTEEIA